MNSILTITMNPAVDLSAAVPNVFPGHKLRCGQPRSDPGGGGINVSRAIKRLGGESTAFHCSGGPTGHALCSLLDDEGIRHQPYTIANWTRQSWTVDETASGQQYRFVLPGPWVSEKEWLGLLSAVRLVRPALELVVASGSLPPGVPDDFYARLAHLVNKCGGRLVLDTSGPPLVAAICEGVHLIKPSLRELEALSGGRVVHPEHQAESAMEIVRRSKVEAAVVSLGAGGVLFATRDGVERMHAPSVKVRSCVGAGDCMIAGITLALSRGEALRDCVRHGMACGTAAVMNPGTELCHKCDVDHLLGQIK